MPLNRSIRDPPPTAIVTGASSGIGKAIAERMAAAEAHVILAGRTAAAMEQSAALIAESGGRATGMVTDVREPRAINDLVQSAKKADGRLDIFVNNAGVAYLGSVIDGEPDAWRAMLETNVLALLGGSQAAIRAIRIGGDEHRAQQ